MENLPKRKPRKKVGRSKWVRIPEKDRVGEHCWPKELKKSGKSVGVRKVEPAVIRKDFDRPMTESKATKVKASKRPKKKERRI